MGDIAERRQRPEHDPVKVEKRQQTEFEEQMNRQAIATAVSIYAEAQRRCRNDPSKVPHTVLELFRKHMDNIDNHLAYRHWDAALSGQTAYRYFIEEMNG